MKRLREEDLRHETLVRHYEVDLKEVPTLLHQIANEMETEWQPDAESYETHGLYLVGIWEQSRSGADCQYVVVLDRD